MATTTEIMAEIASYTAANGRPCPAKHLTDKFGADALPLIDSLKKEGKVYGRRGRNGGLTANNAVSAESETHATPADALTAEFAALAEKLAAEGSEAAIG